MADTKISGLTTATSIDGSSEFPVADTSANYKVTADTLLRRNLIINGHPQVNQRGDSTGITTADYYGPDRWRFNVATLGTWSIEQSTDVPTGAGFGSSLRYTCTTSDASPAAADVVIIQQKIEGKNLQQLKKGTASAEAVTLSFWVRSAKTGTHIVELYDSDNSRAISAAYTISVADTWEYNTATFPGDTTGTLTNDNDDSLILQFWLAAGSNFTGGASLNDSWAAPTTNERAFGQVNVADTNSNIWATTGVQLELGDTATPFEHRDYGAELAACQRYYCNNYLTGETPGDGVGANFAIQEHVCTAASANTQRNSVEFPVEMRTAPTVTLYQPNTVSGSAGEWSWLNESTTWGAVTSTAAISSPRRMWLQHTVTSTLGNGSVAAGGYVADAEL